MRIESEELKRVLKRFSGALVDNMSQSSFKKFSLQFYPENTNPFFNANTQIDVTEMHQNYKTFFQKEGSSFNAFLYYQLIKTMQQPGFSLFRYRYLNEQWYCFDNLPMFISVSVSEKNGQQLGFFIENIASMSWSEFLKEYREGITQLRAEGQSPPLEDFSWYGISHLITTVPLAFNSYSPSQKNNTANAHAPWFVFSKRNVLDVQSTLTLSCTVSHASGLPSELNKFIEDLKFNLLQVPPTQQITSYFSYGH